MKLALFQKDADVLPGVMTGRGIVNVADVVRLPEAVRRNRPPVVR